MPHDHARPAREAAPATTTPSTSRPFSSGGTTRSPGASGGSHSFGNVAVTAPPIQAQAQAQGQHAGGTSPHLDVRSSPIHGKGLFARGAFHPGDLIDVGATARQEGAGRKVWEETPQARYTNHHDQPNAKISASGGRLLMTAGRSIRPDEEVTVDYDEVGEQIGGDRLTWRGKTVPSGRAAAAFFRDDRG